jgi:NitT/TauT family transport system substrate-binding protein
VVISTHLPPPVITERTALLAIPVKLLAIIYAGPPHAIFALADSGIKGPKDLEGKTIADSAFSAIPLIFKAYAVATGVDAQKVKWISADSAALPGLLATGRVDAIGQFTVGEPLLAAAVKPKSLIRLAYKDAGLDYYANGIIATEATIKDNPDVLKAFIRATFKGMRDAFANPTEAGEIMNKYHKEISPEVGKGETELVKELASVPGQKMGVIDETRIQRTIDIMAKSYPMKQAVHPQDMFVPGFVE